MKLKHLIPLLALLASAPFTHAGSHTWNGAVSGYWNNDANWSAGGKPVAGESDVTLVFPVGATRYVTTNNISGLIVTDLTLNGDYTLAGSGGAALTFGGSGATIVINGSHVSTVASSLPVVLNQSVTYYPNHVAARLTIDSTIGGAGGLGQYGPGILVLSGLNANTYAGITQVLRGELRLSQANLFPALAVPGRLVIGTTNLAEPALVRLFENHQIANDNVVVIYPGGALALNGNLDTIGELNMIGGAVTTDNGADPGTLTLADTLTYNHSPVIVGSIAGHLSLGETMRTLDIKSGTLNITATIDDGTANAGFTKTGSGILAFHAANTYDGPTIINGGYLQVQHALALGDDLGPDAATTVNWPGGLLLQNGITVNGETLRINDFGELYAVGVCHWNGSVVLNETALLNVFNGGLCTIEGVISGAGLLAKRGLGTLRLEGPTANTFTGGTLVSHGTLQLAKFSSVTAIPGPLTVGDGLGPADFDQVVLVAHNQIADDAEILINESGLLSVNGFVESLGSITFDGGRLDSGGFFLHLLGDVTTLTNANATAFIDGRFFLSGSGAFDTHRGGVNPGLQIRGQILGDADHPLVKRGLGTLSLSHTNNLYDGLTLVQEGALWLTKGTPGSAASGTVVSNRATLTLSHNTRVGNEPLALPGTGAGNTLAALVSFFGTNWWGGPITLSANAAILVQNPSDLFTVHGAITGNYSLTKTGDGTLELSGDVPNSYTGNTIVYRGVLALDKVPGAAAVPGALKIGYPGTNTVEVRLLGPNQIHDLSAVSILTNSLFNLNNQLETIGSLAGAGRVNLGFASLRAGGNNADSTYSGRISGTILAGFTKEGSGRMFLTGTNTYPGKTFVNGGNLFINGQQSSAVAVNPGASLNGDGLMGAITVTNGVLSPGNDGLFGPLLARLNCHGVTLNENSGFWVDLAGTQAGMNYCQLNVAGAVNLGDAGLSVKLKFASAVSNQFMIVQNDGADAVVGTFKGLPEGATANFSGAQFRISYVGGTGNDVVLKQLTAAPAPTFGGITRLNSGHVQLTGTGVPGLLYAVEANADLNTTNWVHLGETLAQPPAGVLQFVDVDAANYTQRFYRFILP